MATRVASLLHIVALISSLFAASSTSPIVNFNSESACQACCTQNTSPSFDLNACRTQGCMQNVDSGGSVVPGKIHFEFKCNVLGVTSNAVRKGCELGRDYRLMSSSDILGTGTTFCLDGDLVPTAAPVTLTPSPIPSVACESCCTSLNDNHDSGSPAVSGADDFQSASCKDGCNIGSSPNCNSFRSIADHRNRLGCALGMDLKRTGQSFLRELILQCDSAGILAVSTDAPSFAPTTAVPTAGPTPQVVTDSPTTASPTRLPTAVTQTNSSSPEGGPSGDGGLEIIFIVGSISGFLAGAFAALAFVRYRRGQTRAEPERHVTMNDDTWFYRMYGWSRALTGRFSMGSARSSYDQTVSSGYSEATDRGKQWSTKSPLYSGKSSMRKASL